MKIILFNTLRNGDLFFTKEFVRAIVNKNPAHTFSMLCRQFFSIYDDMKNLEVIKRPDIIDFNAKPEDIDYHKEYYIKDNILYINASVSVKKDYIHTYCHAALNDCMNDHFERIIKETNMLDFEPKLVFNKLTVSEYTPAVLDNMKMSDIPVEVRSILKNPCVFYYNLNSLSNVNVNIIDNDKNIEAIANKHSGYTVIAAKPTKIALANVKALSDFNIKEDADGKNLLMYAYIASFCPIVIVMDTGGSQVIFNRYTLTSDIPQHIIYFLSEKRESDINKDFGITIVKAIQKLFTRDNKHLIPLFKYDSDTVLAEIEKIGPIQPPNLPLESSGGRRLAYKSKRRTKKNRSKVIKRQHKKRGR